MTTLLPPKGRVCQGSISYQNVYNDTPIQLNPFFFPGGEPHIQLSDADYSNIHGQYLFLTAYITTAAEWMLLMATLDAVSGCYPSRLGLYLPYFPGARQDRRESGTPFTLDMYVAMLEINEPDITVVLDPHSPALKAVFDSRRLKLHTIEASDLVPALEVANLDGLICPDAGAEKRVNAVAKRQGVPNIIHCRKQRDPTTGALSSFKADTLPGPGKYLVVDDVCDGGGTFIGLAKAIKEANPSVDYSLDLWVSHGIFSKGFNELNKYYSRIITTNSIPRDNTSRDVIEVDTSLAATSIMRDYIGK
jgi:ribose-phosphate pyrophosphokinase